MTQSWSGRTVLVTGGTGFIGSFLVEQLLDRGATVRVPLRAENYRSLSSRRAEVEWMEGDLRDSAYCAQLVRGVDEVFHLAGSRRNSEFHRKRASDVMNDNVRMTLALLDALKECEMRIPVTFFSSANVPPSLDIVTLSQQESVDGYVMGKAICDSLWLVAASQRDFPLLIVRPVGVYGPRDTFNVDGNIIPALMVRARDTHNNRVTLWGDGTQERSFLFVKDMIDALFRLRDAGVTGIQYVTSDNVVSVLDLARQICALIEPTLEVDLDVSRSVAPRTIPVLPVHPVLESMEWTPLQEGLVHTYQSLNSL